MDRSNIKRSSLRDRVDYTPVFRDVDVISRGDGKGSLGDNAFNIVIDKDVRSSEDFLIKPDDLIVTTRDSETKTPKLQVEWCNVPSRTYNEGSMILNLLKPSDFSILLKPSSNSENRRFSASSYLKSADPSVPRVYPLKPCDLKPSRSSGYFSAKPSPEEDRSSQATNLVFLLRPCDFSLSRTLISSSSKSALGKETNLHHVELIRPIDIDKGCSASSFDVRSQTWSSASSLIKVTWVSLLRPCDVTHFRTGSVSFGIPAVLQQEVLPATRQLRLLRPCDLTRSSSTSHKVTYVSKRSKLSPSYFSTSTHLPPDSSLEHDESVFSEVTPSPEIGEPSFSRHLSPAPIGYLHCTASYSCRSYGSWDQSTSWSSSVSSFSSPVKRFPDIVDQTLASISLPNTTFSVRSLNDLTAWNSSSHGHDEGCELGRGVHGAVHLYKRKDTGEPVALKVISLQKDPIKHYATLCQLKKEVHFQELVSKSPYFPKLYGCFRVDEDRVGMAMEFVGDEVTGKSSTLYKALKDCQPALTRQEMLLIASDIVEGLHYLHDRGVLINDLKNDNILIRKEYGKWRGVLIDLGHACAVQNPIRYHFSQREKQEYLVIGRYGHIAPELALSCQTASVASDVFQIGTVFMELGQRFQMNEICQLGCICCSIAPSRRPGLDDVAQCLDAIIRKYY